MLKKLLLSLSLLVATVATHANTLTILNLTGCAYFVDLNEGGRVYVTPISSTFFADPSQVGAGAPATGTFIAATVLRDGYADAIGVGRAPMYPQQVMSSDVVGDFPACNSGNSYAAHWNDNGNIVLLIM